jgi:hypothetical protein
VSRAGEKQGASRTAVAARTREILRAMAPPGRTRSAFRAP